MTTKERKEAISSARSRMGEIVRAELIRRADGRPYLARLVFADRLRIHLFLAGDEGPPHDHPFDFWSVALFGTAGEEVSYPDRITGRPSRGVLHRRVWPLIPRRYLAEHSHRIVRPRLLITVVWNGRRRRPWGFWPLGSGRDRIFVPFDENGWSGGRSPLVPLRVASMTPSPSPNPQCP